jgi:hypothetical protein
VKTGDNSKIRHLDFSTILDIIETLQEKSVSLLKDLSKTVSGLKIRQMQQDL